MAQALATSSGIAVLATSVLHGLQMTLSIHTGTVVVRLEQGKEGANGKNVGVFAEDHFANSSSFLVEKKLPGQLLGQIRTQQPVARSSMAVYILFEAISRCIFPLTTKIASARGCCQITSIVECTWVQGRL